jgi:hypothetical protein
MNSNWDSEQFKLFVSKFLTALGETANRWSSGIFLLVKTILALFSLIATVAVVIVSAEWFIASFGIIVSVLVLVISSFALTAISSVSKDKPQ